MVDAAQNVYNWAWDLAAFVATFGLIQDGDLVTEVLSIGCTGGLAVPDTGLNTHSKSTHRSLVPCCFFHGNVTLPDCWQPYFSRFCD